MSEEKFLPDESDNWSQNQIYVREISTQRISQITLYVISDKIANK